MPRKMQGFIFHTFAAVMTFTVLAFPTPSDLLNTISTQFSEQNLNEIKSFPTIEGQSPPVNNIVDSQEFLPVIEACVVPISVGHDSNPGLCDEALFELSNLTGSTPAISRITTDKEALKIATTFFCRAQWTEQQRLGHNFDVDNCMGPYLGIAQQVE